MSTGHRHRQAARILLLAAVTLAVGAGCTTNRPTPPPRILVPTTTPRPTVQAGTLGQLPPPQPHHGPSLTLPKPPKGLLLLPGSYPLGSQVRFEIPIRNDGDRPVRIDRLEAG
jgi:hypothetical protein